MRDSGQRKLTYSSQNHCTSTLRSGRRKTIVSQTMCALAERLSQSEIVLPLRKACYYSPLTEVGVFSTEIKIQEHLGNRFDFTGQRQRERQREDEKGMPKFEVELKRVVDDSYEIEIGHGLVDQVAADLKHGLAGKVHKFAIITDSNVEPLYARPLEQKLAEEAQENAPSQN